MLVTRYLLPMYSMSMTKKCTTFPSNTDLILLPKVCREVGKVNVFQISTRYLLSK